jgi:hypothetical protein
VRHFKLLPVAKQEMRALEPSGRAALSAAVTRYEMDTHLRNEIKALRGVYATDSRGKRYQLYEVRVAVGNNPFRLLFAHLGRDSQLCLGVTALYKNQQELPLEDKERAISRLKERLP